MGSYARDAWVVLAVVASAVAASGQDPTPANPLAVANPRLIKLPLAFPGPRMENTPIVYKSKPLLVQNVRGNTKAAGFYLFIQDLTTGDEIARFGETFSFVSALVNGEQLNVFATENTDDDWTHDIYRFWTTDLEHWQKGLAIARKPGEHLFNASVCQDEQGYVMAFESNQPVQWSFRFARSKDLSQWEEIEGLSFADTTEKSACANPTLRYFAPYYYCVYGAWNWQGPGKWYEYRLPETKYVTFVARSRDLATWELSPTRYPLLDPVPGEGINNTDADLFEYDGSTYVYYATGDQQTWGTIRVAMYPGPLKQFFESCFPADVPMIVFDARKGRYEYPEAAAKARRQAWFRDAKFGMFVHWGPFAVHGSDPNATFNYLDIKSNPALNAEFEKYAQQFCPKSFDASRWMQTAKEAGARYVILTAKHHDGYALFDSKLTTYDSVDMAPKTDYVRAVADAARAAGLKCGFYYSLLDWREPTYQSDLPKFVDAFVFPQVRELCSQYGPIDCIWFDGEWDHPAAAWKASDLVQMMRQLQPSMLINDRLGAGERGVTRLCDFYTREQPSEMNVPMGFEREQPYPWEACMTIGDYWQYSLEDTQLKSTSELIRILVDVVSRGGNLLLNVGPTPDGDIPAPLVERMRGIGAWLAVNGEGIYGTRPGPFKTLPAGRCTTKANRLYLHLEHRPDTPVQLPGLQNTIRKAWLLEGGTELPIDNAAKSIGLPVTMPDPVVTTIVVELDGPPVVR
jgi:alpha-L-fucosidase